MKIDTASAARTPFQLGQILATQRLALGLDQAEIAERLHTHRPSISNIENGKATIQTDLVFSLLDELQLEIIVTKRQPR